MRLVQYFDDIKKSKGLFCEIPLLREAWDTVRCGGYAYALEEWATEENMVKTLTNFQAQWVAINKKVLHKAITFYLVNLAIPFS